MLAERLTEQLRQCVMYQPKDDGDVVGLPFPYSVPTPGQRFHCLFYWDTYFTNLGLIETGAVEQAKNNVTDMLCMVERFGFMPNGNMRRYLNRSQPPFLSLMVKDVYEVFPNQEWLRRAYNALTREYAFWIKERSLPNGLAHYGGRPEGEWISVFSQRWRDRAEAWREESDAVLASCYMTHAESGWDLNPRWNKNAWEFCVPDLNALLWSLETNMAYFAQLLQNGEITLWESRAERRKQIMTEFLWNSTRGAFMDRNAVTEEFGKVFSMASLYPLFVGMAERDQAIKTLEKLSLLEHPHGVCPCEPHQMPRNYQWDSPNLWPCLQWIAYKALKNYGYNEDAQRIAQKYVSVVDINEAKTGQLWEKYNADTGDCDAKNEYPMPPMLGWSAGVYLKFKKLLTDPRKEGRMVDDRGRIARLAL